MFNEAHLHLAVNHAPVVGFALALLLALVCLFTGSRALHITLYVLMLGCAGATYAALATGEGAEHAVERIPDVSYALLSAHERWAELSWYAALAAAAVALAGLVATLRRPVGALWAAVLSVAVLVVVNAVATVAATLGGGIRHTEIHGDPASRYIHEFALTAAEQRELAEESAAWDFGEGGMKAVDRADREAAEELAEEAADRADELADAAEDRREAEQDRLEDQTQDNR